MVLLKYYMAALIFLYCSSSLSQSFIDSSVGLAFYDIQIDEQSSVSSVGEYAGFAVGQRFKHSLAGAMSLRVWNTSDEDDADGDVNHALFHDFHFAGISLGVHGQIFLPFQAQGPYVKVGRHCWSASVEDVLNIWNGSGCSNIAGAGFLFNAHDDRASGFFTEMLLTRFKVVHSWMLVAGVRF